MTLCEELLHLSLQESWFEVLFLTVPAGMLTAIIYVSGKV
jgi:hypothetical protein